MCMLVPYKQSIKECWIKIKELREQLKNTTDKEAREKIQQEIKEQQDFMDHCAAHLDLYFGVKPLKLSETA